MFGYGKNMEVILYDKDEMKCYSGYLSGITMGQPEQIDATTIDELHEQRFVIGRLNNTAEMVVELRNEIIQLDPTTMKRIARFNFEKENEGLLKEIEEHKKKIKSLIEEYKELKTRLQTISDIGTDIWEHGTKYAEKEEYEESDWND